MKQTSTTRSRSTTKTATIDQDMIDRNMIDRRLVLGGLGATGLGLGWLAQGLPARAMSVAQAEAMIRKVVDEVLDIMNAGKPLNAMLADFEGMFARYADRTRIASSIMGQPWRSASDSERKAYVGALTGYLARKYGKQFRDFEGGKIDITKSNDYGRKGIIVQTAVTTDKWAAFPVDWHVIDGGNGLKFFDIIIEGVKLLATERAEIGAVLDKNRGSVPKLTEALLKMG